jgi:S-adenosylmethionine hydrolase
VGACGRVVWIDRFGNAITDIRRDGEAGRLLAGGASLLIGDTAIAGPLPTFAAGATGVPFWYWGSAGTLEAALRGSDAAARFGWRVGMAVRRVAP